MKLIYVINNFVVGLTHIPDGMAAAVTSSGPAGSTEYEVDDSITAEVGYSCTVTAGVPIFAPVAPAYTPNFVSIGAFLVSITSLELAKLRSSTDTMVQQFVLLVDDARISEIDTNDPRIQFDVQYAAGLVNAPTGATNAGQPIASVCIGLNGDGQARATAILQGNLLAATS